MDNIKLELKKKLMKLNQYQLKLFYCLLVHYWVEYRYFISEQNIFNLRCELNELCHDVDESFPEQYDDFELLKSFCHAHPYYFIDILAPEVVINLFCQYFNDKLDILVGIADKLHMGDLRAVYEYSNEALGLTEDVDVLVTDAEKHVKSFS